MKKCLQCQVVKSDFSSAKKTPARCRPCHREYARIMTRLRRATIEGHKKELEYRKNNRDSKLAKAIERRRLLRLQVLKHYGNACACCGESRNEFLTVDHIMGGGRQHRKQSGIDGGNTNRWLVKNKFPEGFQLLCYNCNCARGVHGYCPHQLGVNISYVN